MNELEIATAIATGDLPSPSRIGASALFALRITGTGVAFRKKHDEHVFRPPENYLTPTFLARCAGLPVVWQHPASGQLDSAEYGSRSIGAITLPYLANGDGRRTEEGTEVWGIARVFDAAAIKLMATEPASTSPSVIFDADDGNETFERDDGSTLLIEGVPSRLDHLAICPDAVWDRGGGPSGIRNDANSQPDEVGNSQMTAENPDDPIDKVLSMMESISTRLDAMEAKAKADDTEKPDLPPRAKREKESEDTDERVKDESLKADAQARADAVASAHSEQAPPPLSGETLRAYRQRLVSRFQRFSPEFRSISLGAVTDPALFDAVEGKIYADAMTVSASPEVAAGHLREVKTRDTSGRMVSTFFGSPSTWLDDFKAPRYRVTKISRE